MATPFCYRRLVQFAETDMGGIVHFSNFFRYMEEAEHAMLRSFGLTVMHQIDGTFYTWPRVHASCDFKSPARLNDEVNIDVSVTKLGTKSVTYQMRLSVDARELAVGTIIAACCQKDPAKGTLTGVAIPDPIRAILQNLCPPA